MNMKANERETPNSLFKAIMKMARESGHFKEIDEILDYDSAVKYDEGAMKPITNCEFNTVFEVDFGGSEGIYIDAYIIDPFSRACDHPKRFHLGTLKTLYRHLDGMKIMGKACGILQYFAREYVNLNWKKFEEQEEALNKTN